MNAGRQGALLTAPLLLLAALGGCEVNPATGEKELILISQEQEIAMGEQAAPEFADQFGGEVRDSTVQQYVRNVGQAVAEVADRKMPYEFTLLNSDVPNAFALPGGKVFVTAGLVSVMTNERQLAAVLGHEIGHVCAKHNVKGLQRQMGAEILASIAASAVGGEAGKAAEVGAKVAGGIINLRYSRKDEYQADELGIRYMSRAGYSPWGMVELLRRLEELRSSGGTLPEFFQTHPDVDKRIDRAQEIVRRNYAGYSAEGPDPHLGRFVEMRDLLIRKRQ